MPAMAEPAQAETRGESESAPKTSAPTKSKWRRVLSWLPGVLLLAGLVAVVSHLGEGRKFALQLKSARPTWILVAALLQAATYVAAAAVWQRVLRRGRGRCTVRSLVPVAVARLFVDQVLPTAGFGGRLLVVKALQRRKVHTGLAVAAILVDLLTLYVAFAVCVVASLIIVAVLRDLNRLVLLLAGLFPIFALSIPAAVLWLSGGKAHRRELPRWIRFVPRAKDLLDEVARAPRRLVRNRGILLEDCGLQLLIFLLDAATLWATLRAVGYDAHPAAVFASFVFAQVAATVLLVPGGLGTFEASAVAMLALFRVPVEVALTATLLLRGFTYWLPMAPGFWLSRREIKAEAKQES
jgi:uncharacterized protein (TIRG00374 family)